MDPPRILEDTLKGLINWVFDPLQARSEVLKCVGAR